MSNTMAKVTIVGRLTKDPETVTFNNGGTVVKFGLARNKRWVDKNTGEVREQVHYYDCDAVGQNQSILTRKWDDGTRAVQKGDLILVMGDLDYREYTTEHGEKRSKHEIKVWDIILIPRGTRQDGEGATARAQPATAPAAPTTPSPKPRGKPKTKPQTAAEPIAVTEGEEIPF